MNIQFDNQEIRFEEAAVDYDPYFFIIAGDYDGAEYSDVVKRTLVQWAEALATTNADRRTFYLPFGVYDQCIECFAATVVAELVTLRRVWIEVPGHTLDLEDLHPIMAEKHEVIKASPDNFGIFGRSELIRALTDAKPVMS